MDLCPCGSGINYEDCCGPLIKGTQIAETAESLMRSRYAAYVKTEIDYILNTTHADQRQNFDRLDSETWSKKTDWHSLEIRRTEDGGPQDETGWVEFVARYRKKGVLAQHHELAQFKKEEGQWFFYDGHAPQYEQVIRQGTKVGRNDPCPCGSGKKHKKCCG